LAPLTSFGQWCRGAARCAPCPHNPCVLIAPRVPHPQLSEGAGFPQNSLGTVPSRALSSSAFLRELCVLRG
jgi:hypothetical protein